MKMIPFPECNTKFTSGEEGVKTAVGLKTKMEDGRTVVIYCWYLSFFDRLKLLFTGKVWTSMMAEHPNPITVRSDPPFYPKGK